MFAARFDGVDVPGCYFHVLIVCLYILNCVMALGQVVNYLRSLVPSQKINSGDKCLKILLCRLNREACSAAAATLCVWVFDYEFGTDEVIFELNGGSGEKWHGDIVSDDCVVEGLVFVLNLLGKLHNILKSGTTAALNRDA